MSDDFEPLTTEGPLPPQISHRRLLLLMVGVIVVGSFAGFAFGSAGFGTGILVGGAMAFANYFWQRNSTRAIFDSAVRREVPALLGVRYILRYVAIGLAVWGVYATGVLPIVAVVLGLAAFAFAVVIEGLIGIFTNFNRQGS